jgi:hypothetical protein
VTKDIAALADRVEAATGPDRELDALIAVFVGVDHGSKTEWADSETGSYIVYDEVAPRYTASLDAAMTLVPEGMSIKMALHPGENFADVYSLGPIYETATGLDRKVLVTFEGHAAIPALALCAAALRAIAAKEMM